MHRFTLILLPPALILLPLALIHCSGPNTPAGEVTYPEACLVENGGAVIDVTRPPYNADNTGKEDVTEILIRAIDDITGADRDLMIRSIEILEALPDRPERADRIQYSKRQEMARENPEAILGFERTAGIFPYVNPPSRILYFPKGTYLVSNTITYSYPDLVNRPGREMNRMIHLQGQSEGGTVIRLKDHSPGFEASSGKAVISFTRGNFSNISMQNTCENLSIEVGEGNPGAVGLEFFCNNTGAVRNVSIRSSGEGRKGFAGLAIRTYNSSCALIQHVTIEGFDFGMYFNQHRLYTAIEHITLRNQHVAGLMLKDHNLAVRGINSENAVPAVVVDGEQSTLVLLDCHLTGGDPGESAIVFQSGCLLARNIRTNGYAAALNSVTGHPAPSGSQIEEYISHDCPLILPGTVQKSLNLPIEETPKPQRPIDPGQWVSVNHYGAQGEGLTDDTEAIQQAMNAGKPVVYFQPGIYLIDQTIDVPPEVNFVNFMYCDLVAGGNLQEQEDAGTFRVSGETEQPLVIEDLFAFERYFGAHYLVDHASTRTLVLSDLHTQVGALYINSISGGKVFIENICCTDQFPPYRNCMTFRGQQVWARQLNPERSNPEVHNNGGRLWVLGFKTEKSGTGYLTTAGGESEILGGIFNISRSTDSSPMLESRDSRVSVFASTTDHQVRPPEWNQRPFVMETRQGDGASLNWNQFPRRDEHLIVLPLYSNIQP